MNQNPIHVNRESLPKCMWHPNRDTPRNDAAFLIAFLQDFATLAAESTSAPTSAGYAGLGLVLDLLADKVAVLGGELAWPEVEIDDSRHPSLMELLEAGQTALQVRSEQRAGTPVR